MPKRKAQNTNETPMVLRKSTRKKVTETTKPVDVIKSEKTQKQ